VLVRVPCPILDGATEDDLKVLIYEMDMLATIEEHPSIVSLLRVCSVGSECLTFELHFPILNLHSSCNNLFPSAVHRTPVHGDGVHVSWRFTRILAQLPGPPGNVRRVPGPSLPAPSPSAVLQGLTEHGY